MKHLIKRSLPFEKTIDAIDDEIAEIKNNESVKSAEIKIMQLEKQKEKELTRIYCSLSRWETVQVARHPDRPKTPQIASQLIPDYISFSGDLLH